MATANRNVEWFVDRSRQRDGFLKMIRREVPKQVLRVVAAPDMGKSWLIDYVHHDCRQRNIAVALVQFDTPSESYGNWEIDSIMRDVADQLGPPLFDDFFRAIDRYTQPELRLTSGPDAGRVSVNIGANSGQVSGSSVQLGDVAGGSIIKDNTINYVAADTRKAEEMRNANLFRTFFAALAAFQKERVTVLLFDTYEKIIGKEADSWVQGELLERIDRGSLPNVVAMVCSREEPFSNWPDLVGRPPELTELPLEAVEEYVVKKRNLDKSYVAQLYQESKQGRPDLLYTAVEALRAVLKIEDDSWLY